MPNYDSVTDFDGARNIVQTAVDAFGTVDILVNNAGIVRDRTLLKMDESDFDAVVAVHLKGTFNCTRHAAEVMKDKGYGRIINITSSAGLRGNFGQTNYGAAKAGIMGMTFVWSMELGRYGITVNAVAPVGRDAHDRRAVRAIGPGTAARGEPGAERAAARVPRVGAGRARERPDPRPHRVLVHAVPAPEADRVDGRRTAAGRRPRSPPRSTRASASTCSRSAW